MNEYAGWCFREQILHTTTGLSARWVGAGGWDLHRHVGCWFACRDGGRDVVAIERTHPRLSLRAEDCVFRWVSGTIVSLQEVPTPAPLQKRGEAAVV